MTKNKAETSLLGQGKNEETNTVSFQFRAPPPKFRLDFQRSSEELWQVAVDWVHDPLCRKYVSWIVKRYARYAAAEQEDIRHLAMISAFEALELCYKKNEDESSFNGIFFHIFKRSCLKMAAGPLQISVGDGIGNITSGGTTLAHRTPLELLLLKEDLRYRARYDEMLMTAALGVMTTKQREAWTTFLKVSETAGTGKANQAAAELGVGRREVYSLLSRGIQKVSKGVGQGLIMPELADLASEDHPGLILPQRP